MWRRTLRGQANQKRALEAETTGLVIQARADGIQWKDIAAALGMSTSGACHKYAKLMPEGLFDDDPTLV